MGFFGQGVWIIGYRGLMGYGMGIPAYQSRRITPLWGFGGYGLFTLWVMRGSTVPSCTLTPQGQCLSNDPQIPFSRTCGVRCYTFRLSV